MSSYLGRHAEWYDLFYATKPYADEAAYIHHCLQKFSVGQTHSLLELACGTGSHALALEKFGYEIVATDYSNDMLDVARNKAQAVASRIDFQHQDMRALALNRTFDAVLCLFDAIGYVATNQALRQVFQSVHRHLRQEGLFVFEFWHAAAMLRHYDPIRVRRWIIPHGHVVRISETQLDYARQLSHVTYSIYELRDDGTYFSLEETQTNRYFLVQEMSEWLTSNGFTPLKWFAGFSDDEKITDETWHIVAIARCVR